MESVFSRLSLSARVWIIFFVCVLGIVINLMLEMRELRANIRNCYEQEIKHLVETAVGVLNHYNGRVRNGEMTLEGAQKEALRVIGAMRYQQGNYIFIADEKGYSLANGVKALIGTSIVDMKDPTGKFFVRELYQVGKLPEGGFVDYLWPNIHDPSVLEPKTSYAIYFPAWRWTAGTGLNITRMESDISYAQFRTVITSGILVLILAGLMTVFVGHLTTPIRRTTEAMRKLSQGDAGLDTVLPETGSSELAELARHFNGFVYSLRTVTNQVHQAGFRLKTILRQVQLLAQDQADRSNGDPRQAQSLAAIEHLLSSVEKVTERSEQMNCTDDAMKLLADQDPLTGLLNRRAFLHELDIHLGDLGEDEPHCLMLMDVDRFKAVNDSFGHDTGDQVLVELSVVLQSFFGEHALACRWGGEEFAVWVPSIHKQMIEQRAEALLEKLRNAAIETLGGDVHLTMSIGVCCHRGPGNTKGLLKETDRALSRAKMNDGDQVQSAIIDS